jgi:hypothetical protein
LLAPAHTLPSSYAPQQSPTNANKYRSATPSTLEAVGTNASHERASRTVGTDARAPAHAHEGLSPRSLASTLPTSHPQTRTDQLQQLQQSREPWEPTRAASALPGPWERARNSPQQPPNPAPHTNTTSSSSRNCAPRFRSTPSSHPLFPAIFCYFLPFF